jgi:P-type Cu2+ transporter
MTAAAALTLPISTPVTTTCFHCGLPVVEAGRYTAVVDGVPRELCCTGCQAVTATISGSGLEAFYRNRDRLPSQAVTGSAREAAARAARELYDRPEIQQEFVETLPDGSLVATLILEGIRCAACIWLNEQHLARQPGVRSIEVNYVSRRARLVWDPAATRLSSLLAAFEAIGYRAWPDDRGAREGVERRERRDALWRLFVAAFGMMQVMMYAYPAYIAADGDITPDIAQLLRIASLVLTVPVVLYSAAPFFRGALRDLKLRRLGMDVPVALGIGAGFLGSCWSTLVGGAEVYFDSVTMFVFFLLCARFLEHAARDRAAGALRHLSRARPVQANRLLGGTDALETEVVPAAALRAGDRVLVSPGETFPADGWVESGTTHIDEALLTGESRPVPRRAGEEITGASINVENPVVVRVTRVGAQTRLAAIVRLVERAQAFRPALVTTADRVASWFVAVVLAVAAITAIAWCFIDPARALPIAMAVLVVTCPCALSLATPAALAVATGAFARRGLVIARGSAIETLANATHVVFDKTGTLTEGRLQLVEVVAVGDADERTCRRLAAILEQGAAHPLALAIAAAATADTVASEPRHVAGAGIEATVEGRRLRIGSRQFIAAWCDTPPEPASVGQTQTEVWLADALGPLAVFRFADRIRADARDVIARLRASGARVLLASGDHAGPVADVAQRVGIEEWHASLTPEGKHALVADLQHSGAKVVMVGDGINDAPVLAQADCAVAMGSGAVLAQTSADIVIVSGRLGALADAVTIARQTLGVIRQNVAWAFAYNTVSIPLAAFGFVAPWAAALGMSASSLLVVANALRLARPRLPRSPEAGRGRDAPAIA